MNTAEQWERALRHTAIIRPRPRPLETFEATRLPYILLSESETRSGRTIARTGEVSAEKPALILPRHSPQFQGFDPEEAPGWDWNWLTSFLLVRGVTLPSLKYENKTQSREIRAGPLDTVAARARDELERREDATTTLLSGPETTWPFSLIIFTAILAARSAPGDLKKLFDRLRYS